MTRGTPTPLLVTVGTAAAWPPLALLLLDASPFIKAAMLAAGM